MAAKKKAKKTATKKAAGKKKQAKKKSGSSRIKTTKKKTAAKKPARKKAPARKVAATKKSARPKVAPSSKTVASPKKRPRSTSRADFATTPEQPRARSGGQSGDLQGLSGIEGADSESVDELLEEGNSFEADVISGVERAGDSEEEEVHTHEVPEDDVPGEYLDED
jgi:hypothetical protein